MFRSFLAGAVLGFAATSPLAAEFIVHSASAVVLEERGSTCQIELRGEIVPGDAAKLSAFLDEHEEELLGIPFWIQGGDGYDLCLNSPGGSYAEGLVLVDVISDRKVGTRVTKDAECASACAVAFLAGTLFIDADFPLRVLEPGARLGFHAPSIELPGTAEIPSAMVQIAYEAALTDISGVIDRLAINSEWGTEPRLPAGLLAKMMSTPPDSMFYISTLNEVGLWDIDLPDASTDSVNLSEANLVQACENLGHWIDGVEAGSAGNTSSAAMYNIRNIQDQRATPSERVTEVELHGVYYKYCKFFVPQGLSRIRDGDIRLAVTSEESGREEMVVLNVWHYLNPEMSLDEVATRGASR